MSAALLSPGSAARRVTCPVSIPPPYAAGYGTILQVGWLTCTASWAPGVRSKMSATGSPGFRFANEVCEELGLPAVSKYMTCAPDGEVTVSVPPATLVQLPAACAMTCTSACAALADVMRRSSEKSARVRDDDVAVVEVRTGRRDTARAQASSTRRPCWCP